MARNLSVAVATALNEKALFLALFVELDFPAGIVRVWSGIGDIVWDTYTWTGVGTLGGVSDLVEASGTTAPGATFELSGIPSANIALALEDGYQNRSARAWLALFDDAGTLIADPVSAFNGQMGVITINDGGNTSTVSVVCEGRNATIGRNRELRYTVQEQLRLFPGDKGLEYVAALQNKEIYWGLKKAPAVVPPRDYGSGYWKEKLD